MVIGVCMLMVVGYIYDDCSCMYDVYVAVLLVNCVRDVVYMMCMNACIYIWIHVRSMRCESGQYTPYSPGILI